jgi:hypothetical protein
MKNKALKITATAIAIFCSLAGFAQQAVTAKAPEVSGPVLQTTAENKTAVPAPATETKLHETAVKQSSFNGPVPVKANDKAEPAAKAPEQKPLPETDKLFPPGRAKNR